LTVAICVVRTWKWAETWESKGFTGLFVCTKISRQWDSLTNTI